MSSKVDNKETLAFCGFCGSRLPDIGAGQSGSCPDCRRTYGRKKRVRRPPPIPAVMYTDEMIERGIPYQRTAAYRDPVLASLLSAVIPGAGQIYNTQIFKGLLVMASFWLVIPYFLGIFDAYLTAERTNCWRATGSSSCD